MLILLHFFFFPSPSFLYHLPLLDLSLWQDHIPRTQSALLLLDDYDLLIGGWHLFSEEHLLILPGMLQGLLPQLVVVREDALPEVVPDADHAGHEEERDRATAEAVVSRIDDRVADSEENVANEPCHGDDEPGEHEEPLLGQHAEHQHEVLGQGDTTCCDKHDQDGGDVFLGQVDGRDDLVVGVLVDRALLVELVILELHLVEFLEDLDVIVEPEGVEGDGGEAAGHPEDGEDERARADGEAAAVGEALRRHLGSFF